MHFVFVSGVHEGSFITFMVCSMLFMLLWCILFKLTATQPMTMEVCLIKIIFIGDLYSTITSPLEVH